MEASAGLSANLTAHLIHPKAPARVHQIRLPKLGRLMYTRDPGDARHTAAEYMQTRLHAVKFDGDGRFVDEYDLGSGLVQQNFVVALMQDAVGTTNNKGAPVMATSGTWMYSGTGSLATVFDHQLASAILGASVSGAIVPTLSYSGNNTVLQYVGTIAYTNTYAVTEWGNFNANVQGAQSTSTTNTWTAQAQGSATWGTTLGAGSNAFAGYMAYQSSASVGMYILSNTSGTNGLITTAVAPTTGYYTLSVAGGSASTPSSNTSTSIFPLMSDHKTFAAINVVASDSIAFTYQLTIQAGG